MRYQFFDTKSTVDTMSQQLDDRRTTPDFDGTHFLVSGEGDVECPRESAWYWTERGRYLYAARGDRRGTPPRVIGWNPLCIQFLYEDSPGFNDIPPFDQRFDLGRWLRAYQSQIDQINSRHGGAVQQNLNNTFSQLSIEQAGPRSLTSA